MQTELFAGSNPDYLKGRPLADRMRPLTLGEVIGHEEILGPTSPVRQAIDRKHFPSLILWGPPGSGKTTLARLIGKEMGLRFVAFSAVMSGIKDVREVIVKASKDRSLTGEPTILFIDEIHRFNRSQQDGFLPHVEDGTIILIGATTENPSFEVNGALLSRCRTLALSPLTQEGMHTILQRAINDGERGIGALAVTIDDDAEAMLLATAQGDGRMLLNILELASVSLPLNEQGVRQLTVEHLRQTVQRKTMSYDKNREEHYNVISAFHKSLRGSDPDGALYWMIRMLESGEYPLYIVRRMVRFASEDIGNSDPQALRVALDAKEAVHFLGMPECVTALTQCALYLATAPKSNRSYVAYHKALADVREKASLPVPLHLRNAPTNLMKEQGYGKGYQYTHDEEDGVDSQTYLPENLKGSIYYAPSSSGFEAQIAQRMEWRNQKRQAIMEKNKPDPD